MWGSLLIFVFSKGTLRPAVPNRPIGAPSTCLNRGYGSKRDRFSLFGIKAKPIRNIERVPFQNVGCLRHNIYDHMRVLCWQITTMLYFIQIKPISKVAKVFSNETIDL